MQRKWAALWRASLQNEHMIKQLPCRVCGKPIQLSEKYGGRAKSAVHAECVLHEPKAKMKAKIPSNESFGVVINRLRKLINI